MPFSASRSAPPDVGLIFDHLADAVYLIDPESSDIVWGNRAAWQMLGLSREQVLDHSVLSLQMDVTGLPQWADIAQAIRATDCFTFVGRHRHREGHEVAVEVNTTHYQADGREYFLSVVRDVSRRLALERELHDRQQRLQFALNEASDGMWDWDLSDNSLFFSPQLKRMLGYGPHEMRPELATWSDNIHPDDAPLVMRALQDHLQGRRTRYEAEYRLRNRNGHYIWVHDRGKVCECDATGQPLRLVGMVQDISERKGLELQLQALLASDTLTGLATRRRGESFVDAQLSYSTRTGTPFGLCFCDLDYFKSINDLYGHLKGDEVLRQAASLIEGVMRKSDLVFRWGGEEFVIACPGAGVMQMREVADRVQRALAAFPWRPQHGIEPLTMSIGIAVYPEHGHDRTELVAAADSALYRAKGAGRNRVVVAHGEPGALIR